MATMQKNSGTSDVLRSGAGLTLPNDSSRALANATETWLAAATECQREMMSFVSMRLEKDAGATRDMMGCKNVADVTAIQTRWVEETLRDYNSEMSKLMAICTNSMSNGANVRRG